jgi:urease gamma subunit
MPHLTSMAIRTRKKDDKDTKPAAPTEAVAVLDADAYEDARADSRVAELHRRADAFVRDLARGGRDR